MPSVTLIPPLLSRYRCRLVDRLPYLQYPETLPLRGLLTTGQRSICHIELEMWITFYCTQATMTAASKQGCTIAKTGRAGAEPTSSKSETAASNVCKSNLSIAAGRGLPLSLLPARVYYQRCCLSSTGLCKTEEIMACCVLEPDSHQLVSTRPSREGVEGGM